MNGKTKTLVVFGVTDDRKARAARFEISQELAARKAAGRMNLRVGIPKTDQAAQIASKLPEGKLFESGLGMIPLVREELFYKLFELLNFDQAWNVSGVISARGIVPDADAIKAADAVWGGVKVASTVLAFDASDPTMFGWSAAIVTAISKDQATLDLRWRDWPAGKPFKALRQAVALLRPDVCP